MILPTRPLLALLVSVTIFQITNGRTIRGPPSGIRILLPDLSSSSRELDNKKCDLPTLLKDLRNEIRGMTSSKEKSFKKDILKLLNDIKSTLTIDDDEEVIDLEIVKTNDSPVEHVKIDHVYVDKSDEVVDEETDFDVPCDPEDETDITTVEDILHMMLVQLDKSSKHAKAHSYQIINFMKSVSALIARWTGMRYNHLLKLISQHTNKYMIGWVLKLLQPNDIYSPIKNKLPDQFKMLLVKYIANLLQTAENKVFTLLYAQSDYYILTMIQRLLEITDSSENMDLEISNFIKKGKRTCFPKEVISDNYVEPIYTQEYMIEEMPIPEIIDTPPEIIVDEVIPTVEYVVQMPQEPEIIEEPDFLQTVELIDNSQEVAVPDDNSFMPQYFPDVFISEEVPISLEYDIIETQEPTTVIPVTQDIDEQVTEVVPPKIIEIEIPDVEIDTPQIVDLVEIPQEPTFEIVDIPEPVKDIDISFPIDEYVEIVDIPQVEHVEIPLSPTEIPTEIPTEEITQEPIVDIIIPTEQIPQEPNIEIIEGVGPEQIFEFVDTPQPTEEIPQEQTTGFVDIPQREPIELVEKIFTEEPQTESYEIEEPNVEITVIPQESIEMPVPTEIIDIPQETFIEILTPTEISEPEIVTPTETTLIPELNSVEFIEFETPTPTPTPTEIPEQDLSTETIEIPEPDYIHEVEFQPEYPQYYPDYTEIPDYGDFIHFYPDISEPSLEYLEVDSREFNEIPEPVIPESIEIPQIPYEYSGEYIDLENPKPVIHSQSIEIPEPEIPQSIETPQYPYEYDVEYIDIQPEIPEPVSIEIPPNNETNIIEIPYEYVDVPELPSYPQIIETPQKIQPVEEMPDVEWMSGELIQPDIYDQSLEDLSDLSYDYSEEIPYDYNEEYSNEYIDIYPVQPTPAPTVLPAVTEEVQEIVIEPAEDVQEIIEVPSEEIQEIFIEPVEDVQVISEVPSQEMPVQEIVELPSEETQEIILEPEIIEPSEETQEIVVEPVEEVTEIVEVPSEETQEIVLEPVEEVTEIVEVPSVETQEIVIEPVEDVEQIIEVPSEEVQEIVVEPEEVQVMIEVPSEETQEIVIEPVDETQEYFEVPSEETHEIVIEPVDVQEIIEIPSEETQEIVIEPVEVQEIVEVPSVETQEIVIEPVDDVEEIIEVPSEEVQEIVVEPEEVQVMIEQPSEETQEIIFEPVEEVTEIAEVPSEETQEIFIEPVEDVEEIIEVPSEEVQEIVVEPVEVQEMIEEPSEESQEIVIEPIEDVEEIIEVPSEEVQEIVVEPEEVQVMIEQPSEETQEMVIEPVVEVEKIVEIPSEETQEIVIEPIEHVQEIIEVPSEEIQEIVIEPAEDKQQIIEVPSEETEEIYIEPQEDVKEIIEVPSEEIQEIVIEPLEDVHEIIEIPSEESQEIIFKSIEDDQQDFIESVEPTMPDLPEIPGIVYAEQNEQAITCQPPKKLPEVLHPHNENKLATWIHHILQFDKIASKLNDISSNACGEIVVDCYKFILTPVNKIKLSRVIQVLTGEQNITEYDIYNFLIEHKGSPVIEMLYKLLEEDSTYIHSKEHVVVLKDQLAQLISILAGVSHDTVYELISKTDGSQMSSFLNKVIFLASSSTNKSMESLFSSCTLLMKLKQLYPNINMQHLNDLILQTIMKFLDILNSQNSLTSQNMTPEITHKTDEDPTSSVKNINKNINNI